jgi:hypothetical protein
LLSIEAVNRETAVLVGADDHAPGGLRAVDPDRRVISGVAAVGNRIGLATWPQYGKTTAPTRRLGSAPWRIVRLIGVAATEAADGQRSEDRDERKPNKSLDLTTR